MGTETWSTICFIHLIGSWLHVSFPPFYSSMFWVVLFSSVILCFSLSAYWFGWPLGFALTRLNCSFAHFRGKKKPKSVHPSPFSLPSWPFRPLNGEFNSNRKANEASVGWGVGGGVWKKDKTLEIGLISCEEERRNIAKTTWATLGKSLEMISLGFTLTQEKPFHHGCVCVCFTHSSVC